MPGMPTYPPNGRGPSKLPSALLTPSRMPPLSSLLGVAPLHTKLPFSGRGVRSMHLLRTRKSVEGSPSHVEFAPS